MENKYKLSALLNPDIWNILRHRMIVSKKKQTIIPINKISYYSRERYLVQILKLLFKISRLGVVKTSPNERGMLIVLLDNIGLQKIERLCKYLVTSNSVSMIAVLINCYNVDITKVPDAAKCMYEWLEMKDSTPEQRSADFKKLDATISTETRKKFIAVFLTTFSLIHQSVRIVTFLFHAWKHKKPDAVSAIPDNISNAVMHEFCAKDLIRLYCDSGKNPQSCAYLLMMSVRLGDPNIFSILFKILFDGFEYMGPICEGAIRELVKKKRADTLRCFFNTYGDKVLPWLGKKKRTVWRHGRYSPLSPAWFQKLVILPLLLSNSLTCIMWACYFTRRYFTTISTRSMIRNMLEDISKQKPQQINQNIFRYIYWFLKVNDNDDGQQLIGSHVHVIPLERCLAWYENSTGRILKISSRM